MKPHTEETKKKIGNSNKGKKRSKETRERISLASSGRKYSDEVNKKKGLPLSKNPNWKGGQYRTSRGYMLILAHDHPNANKQGYVKRANLVMEKHLGRYLIPPELVHHKNSIVDDDRIENLQLFSNHSQHLSSSVDA